MGFLFSILAELQKLNGNLTAVRSLIQEAIKKMSDLGDAITTLKDKVTALTTVEQSAVALLNGLTSKINEIIAAGGDPAQALADIQALNTRVQADTDELAAAVAANTPAAP